VKKMAMSGKELPVFAAFSPLSQGAAGWHSLCFSDCHSGKLANRFRRKPCP
jgi:hypothetical protein